MKSRFFLGVGMVAILVAAILFGGSIVSAFSGPSSGAGSGSGAIGVDSNNNLSIGTSTPLTNTKLYISGADTSSSNYALRIVQPSTSPLFVVRNDGSVGVATSSPNQGTLTVNGTIYATGGYTGTISASNVTANVFASGNFAFPSSLGVATSTQVGLPQELSVWGDGYFTGNLGLGTSSPVYKLDVNGSARLYPSSAPTAARGVLYFDSGTNKFKCSEDGSTFVDCIASGSGVTGSGTSSSIAIWTGASSLGNSIMTQNASTLTVAGTLNATALGGSLNASNVTAGVFGSGNFAFPSSLGIGTSTTAGLPQELSVWGDGYLTGSIGLGTTATTPSYKLDIHGAASTQLHITGTGADSGLYLMSIGADNAFYMSGGNFNGSGWVAKAASAHVMTQTGGSFAYYANTGLTPGNSFTPTEIARLSSAGFAVGTTNQAYKLEVAGTARFTGDVLLGDGSGTDLTVGSGSGKIDVGTIDPVYTIGGVKYATYVPAMIGIKEEMTGTIPLTRLEDGSYGAVIDFSREEKGSDLWLFSKTTNLRNNFKALTILLSSSFEGSTWYEKNADSQILSFYAKPRGNVASPEVSYRLSAPRFDASQWTNYSTNPAATGFILNDD